MTPKQCAIAADIIEAGRFTLNDQSDDDAVEAAAFVFDQGVLYLPTEGKREIVAMLRERATQEPS